MQTDQPPEPPDGPEPRRAGRPAAPVTSIQQFESPDAAEASVMADQRSAEHATTTTTEDAAAVRGAPPSGSAHDARPAGQEAARGSAAVPGVWPPARTESARGSARVRPTGGSAAGRPAAADVQTSAGVPARPIPDAAASGAANAPARPDTASAPASAPVPVPVPATEAPAKAVPVNGAEAAPAEAAPAGAAPAAVDGGAEVAEPPAAPPKNDTEVTKVIERPAAPATNDAEETEVIERPAAPARKAIPLPAGPAKPSVTGPANAPAPGPVKAPGSQPAEAPQPRPVKAPGSQPAEAPQPRPVKAPAEPRAGATVTEPAVAPARRPSAEETQVIRPDEVGTQKIVVVPGRGERTVTVPPAHVPPQPEVDRRRTPRGGPFDLGHAPAVLLLSSLGVLLVALAYTAGREGGSWGTTAYWIGQVVVFTPVVLRLLSRRMAGVAESFLLVVGLAVNQYLLKWMYSPDQFRFPDELQHWLATTTIMETGELFRPNPALPPAVHFPGLAEMAAALASMTGLPVTASGIIVAGVAHLVFVGVLFVCVLRTSNSPAVAGVACATYATALHYLFFSSMFLYQTAALPFFMLAIWATRRWREEGGRPFVVVAVASIAMTAVSHHVTAFALIATLLLLGVTELVTDRPRRWSALAMPAVASGVVAAWILLVAQDVIGYLEEPVDQVITTVSALVDGTTTPAGASAPVSIAQLVLQGTGLIGLFVLYVAVGRDMVTRRDSDWWRWAALVGGAIFFAGNGVRFLGQNGPEIAGRLSTFTYIPISIIAAISLVRAVQILPSRDADGRRWWVAPALEVPPPTGRNLVVRVLAGSALVTLLMIGARAGGWPPLGSLLPGPYVAGGFERSVDAYGVAAAEWQRDALGPGNRVGGDVTSVSLSSTYGRQDPVREVGPLYYADRWTLADDELVTSLDVDYLVVDRRLGTQLPQNDAYFENDPRAGRITQPLTVTQLGKFDALADVDRLYDNGTVRIYRMGGAR